MHIDTTCHHTKISNTKTGECAYFNDYHCAVFTAYERGWDRIEDSLSGEVQARNRDQVCRELRELPPKPLLPVPSEDSPLSERIRFYP